MGRGIVGRTCPANGIRRFLWCAVCLSVVLTIGWASALPAQASQPPSDRALMLLASGADADSVVEAIQQAGGRVTHVFPQAALIGQLPLGAQVPAGVDAVYRQAVDGPNLSALTGVTRRAAQVWNALLSPPPAPDALQSLAVPHADIANDAMVPPPPEPGALRALSSAPTPQYDETSEYFIGRVAVGIILPESDGSLDLSTEDWTEAERALVLSKITAALDWWAVREPNAHLTFVYDDGTAAPVATRYEPITRPYGHQSFWIADVMERMGYTGFSVFDQVRTYDNALRQAYGTDWAFTIFVVDSSNDRDRLFADGYFAYAYLGGPFMVMTSGNDGYGPENMDAVAAHEIGHIFLALDQYSSASQPCTRRSGYLGAENQNSQYGTCASNQTSIMRGQVYPYRVGAVDPYARAQLGWRDSDGDGILDPMDTTLSVSGVTWAADAGHPNVLTFSGTVQDNPYPSPLRRSILINTIARVQYRVAGGGWAEVYPADGRFDAYTETFTFTTPPLPGGDLAVDLRVVDTAGNELVQTIATASVTDPVDAILDTTLTRLVQSGEVGGLDSRIVYAGQGTSTASFIAGAYYRIDDAPWQPVAAADGAFDESQESFTVTVDLSSLSPGLHRVQAYSVDGLGNVETSPASDTLSVQQSTHSIFLPILAAGH
jgi:hypothetical protein